MSTVVPQSELTRRAMDWIGAQVDCHPGVEARVFIEPAAERFNLSPLEVEFLQRFYVGAAKGEQHS